VKCDLKPHATIKGACINGKDCQYKHADTTANQKKCAQLFPPPALKIDKRSDAIVYSPIFDATLGFPGEGPITVATYNINGSRGSLAAIFAQAKIARIDILLLQELHFYEDGEHLHVGKTADKSGWAMVHSHATRLDPSSGVAIAVRLDSKNVKPLLASARSVLQSRYITMTCSIIGTKKEFDISSVYLSAQAPARKAQIHTITKCKILKDQAITGKDFNCVESTDLDVRHPAEGGGITYANASGKSLAAL
jgi:hypothetical protein